MTTVTQMPQRRRIPRDAFPNRLALVRAEMGWNYDQAAKATGINSETWRLWEKRSRRCNDIEGVSRKISDATGFAFDWLMVGGPLDGSVPPDDGPLAQSAELRTFNPKSVTGHELRLIRAA